MHVVGISGSPRRGSVSSILLDALASNAGPNTQFTLYESLTDLPHFNPDNDGTPAHAAVKKLRDLVGSADGVMICSPEYAFSIPSVLKNGLEWLVSSGELNEKPVLSISTSPLPSGGAKAHKELRSVLQALGVTLVVPQLLCIGATRKRLSPEGKILDPGLAEDLRNATATLVAFIGEKNNVKL